MGELSYLEMPDVGGGASSANTFGWSQIGQAFNTAGVGTVASGAGTILGFVGSMLAARSAKKATEYNSEILERNAQAAANAQEIEAQEHLRNQAILLGDITMVRQAQAEQERSQRLVQEHQAGMTRAIVGSSGLLMRGSPLAVYETNLRESQREILAGRYRADVQERALRDQAVMQGYAAQMARYGAGERLRVGKAQGALARYGGGQQQFATTLGAFGNLAAGGARTYAAYERRQTLQGGVTPYDTTTKVK